MVGRALFVGRLKRSQCLWCCHRRCTISALDYVVSDPAVAAAVAAAATAAAAAVEQKLEAGTQAVSGD